MTRERLPIYAWSVLGFNLLVIVWGAYVRATGSGAGCGSHWPLCNGEVMPRDARIETLIEFTHRASSGLALLAVVVLAFWALRAWPAGHRVRAGAWSALAIIIVEALLGLGLVRFGLVADDASPARAVAMMIHLVNTFLLLASLALTAWWAGGGRALRVRGTPAVLSAIGLLAILVTGASGAIAALGDTLFPSLSVAEGLAADLDPTSHILLRLRLLHPLLAIATAGYLLMSARALARVPGATGYGALTALVLLQIAAGVANVFLLAPVWLQLGHLLLADLVWIAAFLLSASALQLPQAAPAEPAGVP